MKPLLVFGALKECIHFFETPGILNKQSRTVDKGWTDSLEQPRHLNIDMRFGTWKNILVGKLKGKRPLGRRRRM
jgi:hypothetical protein